MMSAVFILTGYLLGSLSFAVLVSKAMGLPDPHSYGSGNPGATNVLRSGSKAAAGLTLLGDAAKGWVAVVLAQCFAARFGLDEIDIALVALAAFMGHLWPVFFRFKGGKGVATAAGILLALDWRVALGTLATFAIIAGFFRISSLASMTAALFAAFFTVFLLGWGAYAYAVCAMVALLLWRHRSNIRKLIAGTENRFGRKKSPQTSE